MKIKTLDKTKTPHALVLIAEELGIKERSVEKRRQKNYSRSNSAGATSFLKFAFKKGLDLLGGKSK